MILNKTIILYEPMPLNEVKRKAKELLEQHSIIEDSRMYIYIEQPTVSDLFICENNTMRRCTDEQWNDYFKKNIGIPPKPKKKQIYFYSGIRHK